MLCKPGDLLIIIAYEERDRTDVLNKGHQAKVLVADENNHCKKFMYQNLTSENNQIEFSSSIKGNRE